MRLNLSSRLRALPQGAWRASGWIALLAWVATIGWGDRLSGQQAGPSAGSPATGPAAVGVPTPARALLPTASSIPGREQSSGKQPTVSITKLKDGLSNERSDQPSGSTVTPSGQVKARLANSADSGSASVKLITTQQAPSSDSAPAALAEAPKASRVPLPRPASPAQSSPAKLSPAQSSVAAPGSSSPESSMPAIPLGGLSNPSNSSSGSALPAAPSARGVEDLTVPGSDPTQSPVALPPPVSFDLPSYPSLDLRESSTASDPSHGAAASVSMRAERDGRPQPDFNPAQPSAPPAAQIDLGISRKPAGDNHGAARMERPSVSASASTGLTTSTSLPLQAVGDRKLTMQSTRVQVYLRGPTQFSVGVPSPLAVIVENSDQVDLDGLIVRLDIPGDVVVEPRSPSHGQVEVERSTGGVTLITWSFAKLKAGQQATAPMEVVVQTASDFTVQMEWTLQPLSGQTTFGVLSPRLDLQLDGPSEVSYGVSNTYRLKVSNRGTADARDVTVHLSAQQFGSSSLEIGTLPAGTSEVVDVELVFNEPGQINVAARAVAGSLSSAAAMDIQVRQARLEVQLDAPRLAYHGMAAPYVLRIHNTGDATAREVRADVQLPPAAQLVSASRAALVDGNQSPWNLADLPPGAVGEVNFLVSLTSEGANQFTAGCVAAEADRRSVGQ